ncbi:MAG: ATP-binding protein [Candidatus Saccharimonadales bacterium]
MVLKRYLNTQILDGLDEGLVVILYGARQTGKTTLARQIMDSEPGSLYLNCDEPDVRLRLTNKSSTELRALFGSAKLVVIDEAQRVENIGLTAKLVHDTFPEVKLLLTGSSSIDLANTIKEPLTGRSRELTLYPLAASEVANDILEAERLLEKSLVIGAYPQAWQMGQEAAEAYLRNLVNNYLYRDAFAAKTIYDTTVIDRLLRLLAFQVGNEVSYSEIAGKLEVAKETVMRYIDLLEKAFIIFRLGQYRKNQRTEVGRLRKVYFYDLGVRNGLIDNFAPLEHRDDTGSLWENYCVVERKKYLQKNKTYARHYFWRSYTRQEVDLVEEIGPNTQAFEFKYKEGRTKTPPAFSTSYPDVQLRFVSKTTVGGFLF